MSDLQSSPSNDKPVLDGLFPDLKRPAASSRAPRFMADALAASSLLGKGPLSRPSVPPPPVIRSKSAPPPAPPRSKQLQVIEEVEAELVADTPIVPTDDAYLDEGPTVLRASPLLPPLSARPQLAPISVPRPTLASPPPSRTQPSLSKPKASAPVPPSMRAAPPPSGVKLPPLPTPPPSLRSNPKPASAPKLPPLPTPPSTLRNLAPPSAPVASAPVAAPVDDEAETVAPPTVRAAKTRDSVAPAAQLMASTANSNRYVPPSTPPRSVRPLSALETIPASRYHHSLAPQVLSQSIPAPAPAPRKSRLGWALAAAATLGACAVTGFFALGGAKTLGIGSGGNGSLAITAAGPGNSALTGVRVIVDGAVACASSPCELPALSAGTHFVTVEAPGFSSTAARAISVERGAGATLHVELVPEQTATPAAAEPKADVEKPTLPQTPTTEPAKTAELQSPASEAAAKTPTVEARRPRTEAVAKKDAPEKAVAKTDAPKKEEAPAAAPAAASTLNINSIPVANVVLDGRPMGSTPLIGVSVSPGAHSVVFIHPELGRKASGTTVKAGSTATVAVRF